MTVDNCDSSSNLERWLYRSLAVGEVVSINWEEVEAVATALGVSGGAVAQYYVGISAGLEAKIELQNEISRQFGTGLTSGQTKTQDFKIAVGPRQTAVTTLNWIETWEDGYIEVFKDGQYMGKINYHLLVDLQLDSSTKTYDCSLIGRMKQAFTSGTTRMGISIRSMRKSLSARFSELQLRARDKWRAASNAWPLGHLDRWVAIGVVVIGGFTVVLIRRRRRLRADEDSFYW